MATKWEETARSADTDSIDAKIGNSTDGETAATVFGKMLGMRNVVDWIKNTWTVAKAGLLDVAVSTRAPASTALSTATWTATRAGRLDNLDGTISTRAPASTALSNSIWTNARASSLDNLSGLSSVGTLRPSNVLRHSIVSSQLCSYSDSNYVRKVKLGSFIPEKSGMVKVLASMKMSTDGATGYLVAAAVVATAVPLFQTGFFRLAAIAKESQVYSDSEMDKSFSGPMVQFTSQTYGLYESYLTVQAGVETMFFIASTRYGACCNRLDIYYS